MSIPRWQQRKEVGDSRFENVWDKLIACVAIANLSWFIFDITYIPLRGFWVNRTISVLDPSERVISLKWIPNITTSYDQIKGIRKKDNIEELKRIFYNLDQAIISKGSKDPLVNQLVNKYHLLLEDIIGKNSLVPPRDFKKLESIRIKINTRAGINSSIYSYPKILTSNYIDSNGWEEERQFWLNAIIPQLNTSYSITNIGKAKTSVLILILQSSVKLIFLIDIIIKVNLFKKRFPKTNIRDNILRRWIDLPIFIPFINFLVPLPLIERIYKAKLINTEPIRAIISQWIVTLLAIEIFEVLTIRAINSIENIILSPLLPNKIRKLCSHQSIKNNGTSNISEFIRIWIPLILKRIGPNMRFQIIELFEYSVQKSINTMPLSSKIKRNIFIENAESAISAQIASGMVDSILGVSKNAGNQLEKKDIELERLTLKAMDKFWEELALALENDITLKNSRLLLLSILEELKVSSLNELKNQANAQKITDELDKFNFN